MGLMIISDNKDFSSKLSSMLNDRGYKTDIYDNDKDALNKIVELRCELILIDLDFLNKNSYSLILDLKRLDKKLSIVAIVTSETDKDQEIKILGKGADDYINQPFSNDSFEEKNIELFITRLETRLRFGGTNIIEIENLIIDPDEEKIFFQNKEIELKGKPFEVLTHLAKNRGQIVSKEQLLDAIWEEPELVTPNVIEVAINQIRQKMDKPLEIGTIETVRRRGYRFCFPKCNKETNIVTA